MSDEHSVITDEIEGDLDFEEAEPTEDEEAAEEHAKGRYVENPDHQPSPYDYDDRSIYPGEDVRPDYVQHMPYVLDTIDTTTEGMKDPLEHLPDAASVSNLPDGGYMGTPTDDGSPTPEDIAIQRGVDAADAEAEAKAQDDGSGTGDDGSEDEDDGLDELSAEDLHALASEEDTPGRSGLNKEDLIEAIRAHREEDAADGLKAMSVGDLHKLASEESVAGHSSLNKGDLVDAIRAKRAETSKS